MASDHLQALDMVAQGDWHGAHELIQDSNDELACLIHDYLHREKGHLNNVHYW